MILNAVITFKTAILSYRKIDAIKADILKNWTLTCSLF